MSANPLRAWQRGQHGTQRRTLLLLLLLMMMVAMMMLTLETGRGELGARLAGEWKERSIKRQLAAKSRSAEGKRQTSGSWRVSSAKVRDGEVQGVHKSASDIQGN